MLLAGAVCEDACTTIASCVNRMFCWIICQIYRGISSYSVRQLRTKIAFCAKFWFPIRQFFQTKLAKQKLLGPPKQSAPVSRFSEQYWSHHRRCRRSACCSYVGYRRLYLHQETPTAEQTQRYQFSCFFFYQFWQTDRVMFVVEEPPSPSKERLGGVAQMLLLTSRHQVTQPLPWYIGWSRDFCADWTNLLYWFTIAIKPVFLSLQVDDPTRQAASKSVGFITCTFTSW